MPSPWLIQRISVRDYLNVGVGEDGLWTVVDHLWCSKIVLAASPQKPWAEFAYVAGEVIQPGETSWDTYARQDIAGKIIKVELLDPDDASVLETFFFDLVKDEQMVGGVPGVGQPQPIRQQLVAVGLEDLLDRCVITGAYVYIPEDPAEDPVTGKAIHTPLAFNERYRRGYNKTGNRSAVTTATGFTVNGSARSGMYAFDAITQAGVEPAIWTIKDILEYLQGYYVTSMSFKYGWQVGTPTAQQTAVRDALAGIKPPAFGVEGMTVKQAIDRLINPERGLGWCFKYEPTGDGESVVPILDIFPVHNAAIVLDGVSIPANTDTVAINATNTRNIVDVLVGKDRSVEYGELILLGAPVLSCFTVSEADGTLDKGWTTAEQSAYLATLSLDADQQPDHDKYANVWSKFIVPLDWDGFAGNGIGTTFDPKPAHPLMLDDATPSTTIVAPLNRRGHGFEPVLPIPREQQDDATPEIEYQEAFALLKIQGAEGEVWEFSDRMSVRHDKPDVRFAVAENELAVYLRGGDQRELSAAAGWEYNWIGGMLATVAMRCEQRLWYRKALAGQAGRRLVVEVPDAELWLVNAQTVIGVSSAGALRYYAGSGVERTDAGRLKEIAETMAVWYGSPRRSLQLAYQDAHPVHAIGQYMNVTVYAGESAIGNCITSRVIDFTSNRITLGGAYRDLTPFF